MSPQPTRLRAYSTYQAVQLLGSTSEVKGGAGQTFPLSNPQKKCQSDRDNDLFRILK